jgi:tRNA-dihydrouridine synthase A
MIGRAAYQSPYVLAEADRLIFGESAAPKSREEIVADFLPYVARQRGAGVPLNSMTRHMLGLFNGLPGARAWRRCLAEEAHKPGAGPEVIEAALKHWRQTQERQQAA